MHGAWIADVKFYKSSVTPDDPGLRKDIDSALR